MRRILRKLSVIAILSAAVASCAISGSRGNGDDNYYSAFHTFDSQEWRYTDPVTFAVDTLRDRIAHRGTLLLSVRHTTGYEYSNLWLEMSYPLNDSVIKADTFNIILADDFGNWRGTGIGPSLQTTDTLATDFTIKRKEEIKLRHIMRVDNLAEIEQVGIIYLPNE